ncbi:MAG: YbaK/EbsC family protein [Spirochaetaceae bacterium]
MIAEQAKRQLSAHGLEALGFEPGTTPTSVAAAERIGVSVGQIAKSMPLRSKDCEYSLVLMPGDHKLNNGKLKAELGAKTRMATPEETETATETGYRPGGLRPSGIDPPFDIGGLRPSGMRSPASGSPR